MSRLRPRHTSWHQTAGRRAGQLPCRQQEAGLYLLQAIPSAAAPAIPTPSPAHTAMLGACMVLMEVDFTVDHKAMDLTLHLPCLEPTTSLLAAGVEVGQRLESA